MANTIPLHYSDSVVQAEEETVFELFVKFVKTLILKECRMLLKYVTGKEVYIGSMFVDFNGQHNPQLMYPPVHTCSQTISLVSF